MGGDSGHTDTENCCPEDHVGDANIVGNKAVVFSLKNQVGGLVRALRVFQEVGIDVCHIESRKSRSSDSEYEIYVDIDCDDHEKMSALVHHLRHEVDGRTLEEFERSKNVPAPPVGTRRGPLLSQPSVDNGTVSWLYYTLLLLAYRKTLLPVLLFKHPQKCCWKECPGFRKGYQIWIKVLKGF